jgi:hypothetical protein
MHEILVSGIVRWLQIHPGFNRSHFLLEAATAKLNKDGIILRQDAVERKQQRRLSRPRTVSGHDEEQSVLAEMVRCVEKIKRLSKRRVKTSKGFNTTMTKARARELLTEDDVRQLNLIKSKLLTHVDEMDKELNEAGQIRRKAKRIGLM